MLLTPSRSNDNTKRSLILAGGGMRVAYQAGVLKAMEEEGLSFHHVDGTSGGTMNTAMLFSDVTPNEMCQRWSTLDVRHFVSFMPMKAYRNPLKTKAMGDADGIINKVFPHLGIDITTLNQPRESEATFNVCNFSTKQNVSISHKDVTLSHLIAGISLPIFMPSIKINGDWYTDSVWIKDANLMEAVKRGAEELWLVWCIGNSREYKEGAFLQYVHMIELSANGALLEEYERIEAINQSIRKGDSPYGQVRPIKLHVVKPIYPIPLDPDFYVGCITGYELVNIGYQNAKQYLRNHLQEGVALNWQATNMAEPGITLITRQLFKTETVNKHLGLQLRLRAEGYNVEAGKFKNNENSFTVFGDMSIDTVIENQPAASGTLQLKTKPADVTCFTLEFVNYKEKFHVHGTIESVPLWKMLLGKKVMIKLSIEKDDECFDQAVIKISLPRLLGLYYGIQIKGANGVLQRIKLKHQLLKRLVH